MQCLRMGRYNHAGPGFWLSLPLVEFPEWIGANNQVAREDEEERR